MEQCSNIIPGILHLSWLFSDVVAAKGAVLGVKSFHTGYCLDIS